MTDIVYPGKPSTLLNEDLMPQNVDLIIYRGDYVEVFLNMRNSDEELIDISGQVPKAQLKENYDSQNAIDFECSLISDDTVRIYLPSFKSYDLQSATYIWDFQLTNADGDERTFFTGDVTVLPGVTGAEPN